MVKNHCLAKSISDASWSMFRSVLTRKAESANREIYAVNPAPVYTKGFVMTTVAILPVPMEKGGVSYRGIAGDVRSQGSTVGEALDALTTQLADTQAGLLVLVQSLRPDQFFDASQQRRLEELMASLRQARAVGSALPPNEQMELDELIEAELYASASRSAMLADEAGR
jgi:hypothetical protein